MGESDVEKDRRRRERSGRGGQLDGECGERAEANRGRTEAKLVLGREQIDAESVPRVAVGMVLDHSLG